MAISHEEGFGRATRQKPVVNSPRKSIHGVLKWVLTWAALSEVLTSLVSVEPQAWVSLQSPWCVLRKPGLRPLRSWALCLELSRTTAEGCLGRRWGTVEERSGCRQTSHWMDLISRDSYSKCSKLQSALVPPGRKFGDWETRGWIFEGVPLQADPLLFQKSGAQVLRADIWLTLASVHALFPVLLSRDGFSYTEYGVGVIFFKKLTDLKK